MKATVNRWTFLLLLAALVLPTLMFAALQIGFTYRAERRSLEVSTLSNAEAIMAKIDGNAERTKASALALATSVAIRSQNWPAAYQRARQIAELNPDWRSVGLIDVARSQALFDLERSFGAPVTIKEDPKWSALVNTNIYFGMVERPTGERPFVLVQVPIMRKGRLANVLVIKIDPATIQSLLVSRAHPGGTSAVVDRKGNFIARTRDYVARVGTPATHYVRDAVKAGGSGFYSSITYEGLVSYTAYATSHLTGWSTHLAVPASLFDTPIWWSYAATATAVLLSLLLAVGLGWALLRIVTAQRKADARMQQAERLEAVGKMTGGIAHDFNNMLAIVMGNLELMQRRIASGRTDVQRYADNAMDGASRAAELTRRLLAFSRRQSLAAVPVDLNRILIGLGALVTRTLGQAIHLEYRLLDAVCCALIDPGQFENAIINLAANARDAMTTGGTVTLETKKIALNAQQAKASGLEPGSYIIVRVTDTGDGMPPEIVKRVFEPFFTTKEVGRGTGLGLSQIYGFMEQSGGRARVESRTGLGTTVTLYLPQCDLEPDTSNVDQTLLEMSPTGSAGEVILIAEDEDQVRQTSVETLRELGYTVLQAANGNDALEIIRSNLEIKLLFTDIVMPGMSGRNLAAEALTYAPNLKILFATGYERDMPTAKSATDDANMLRKPYALNDLAKKVRTALDA